MKSTLVSAAALLASLSSVRAQDTAPTCSPSRLCPEEAPCCSQYGQCGAGAYCLGGCDPKSSFTLQSCMAAPTCKSGDFKMDSLDTFQKNTEYLGDASKADWVTSGTAVAYNGDSILLTMAPSTVGTLVSSTNYVWYGKISVTMTSSQGQGVVTAFILMSDVKDEIDFEFVGDDVSNAQSNYYYQGITNYENMIPLETSNTRDNAHTYTIDWTPDQVIWSINGNEMRTLNKKDTWNETSGSYHFPQSPSRIQLSLWPAGLPTNGEGTIEWAGGLVDWDDTEHMQNGYYYAIVKDVQVECYDPPSEWSNPGNGDSAYYYTDRVGNNDTVAIGNNNTILSSFFATGDNPDFDPNARPSGSSSTAAAPSMAATPQTVPGMSGGGNVANGGGAPIQTDGDDSSNGGTVSGSSNSGSGFSQGGGSSGGSSDTSQAPKIFAGSAVALVGFFVAALML